MGERIFKRGLRYAERRQLYRFVNLFRERIAATYDSKGDKATALEILKTNIQSNPEEAMGYFDLAEFNLFNNEGELAVENYKKALQLETDEQMRVAIRFELDLLRR